MTGLIWFVQLVHYPLLSGVGTEGFHSYQRGHERRTAWAVGPAMLAELVCAVWLAAAPPPGVFVWLTVLGLVLLAGVWVSTALLQVPCHRRLSAGFDAETHGRLVRSNWLRTALWSGRAVLALWMLACWADPLSA